VKIIIPKDDANFIIFKYLPRLGVAVKDIELTAAEKTDLIKKTGGTLIKIAYAFLWQEFFVPLPFLYDKFPLHIGGYLAPYVNSAANSISGFP